MLSKPAGSEYAIRALVDSTPSARILCPFPGTHPPTASNRNDIIYMLSSVRVDKKGNGQIDNIDVAYIEP